MRQLLETFCFTQMDLQSLTLPRGGKAPVALSESKFDLAFIDISLPNGNGFTVYTKIKKNQYTPIIFLTASGDEESVVTGLNTCTDDYITQSFRSHELIARIGSDMVKKDGSEVFLS